MDYQRKIEIMSEGNPGALSVLVQLHPAATEWLDYLWEYGPYGEYIWLLYSDHCDKDITLFCQNISRSIQEKQPEVWQALEAENAINRFAEEWMKVEC